jgi:hypothetical protein
LSNRLRRSTSNRRGKHHGCYGAPLPIVGLWLQEGPQFLPHRATATLDAGEHFSLSHRRGVPAKGLLGRRVHPVNAALG